MNIITAIFALFLFHNSFAVEKFDSAHSVLMEGDIDKGLLYSNTDAIWIIKEEINSQLMYSIGQFNGEEGGSPDMAKTTVQIQKVTAVENSKFKIEYKAHLDIAWPNDKESEDVYHLYLPKEGNSIFLYNFMASYGPDTDHAFRCMDYSAHNVGLGNLWYYYRPLNENCPLTKNSDDVVKIPISLKKSDLNTNQKYPEYEKIWEDKKLIATLIFGMNEPENFNVYDAGVSAFSEMIQLSLKNFGELTWSNLPDMNSEYVPKDNERIVHLKFKNDLAEVDLVLILVDEIRRVATGSEIEKMYSERSKISDFMSYNGHSGLGANIRKLSNMGAFTKDQYQIFMVNGCDTFAYIDNALANAHQAVNPDFLPTKFFDIITNSMPSYFHRNADTNLVVLKSLLDKKRSYKEILAHFDYRQRATVVGEEDNQWPLPFLP